MADFVKDNDLDFAAQLENFNSKLPGYATALGLAPTVISEVDEDTSFMSFAVAGIGGSKSYAQGWTDLKNVARKGTDPAPIATFPTPVDVSTPPTAVPPGIEDRFRALVRQIKANPAYTNTMGEDLGIVADEDTTVSNQPALTIKMDGGHPLISFKKGKSDGIRLYAKRGSEADFTFLAVDTHSPYFDNRPNLVPGTTEKREYYAYYFKHDEQYGLQSTVASITV